MSTWAISTTENRGQPAATLDLPRSASPIDVWIGGRVRVKRTSRGMTKNEFSKLLGIDRDDLVAFEAGTERINAKLLFCMAKTLDARPDYFFRRYIEKEMMEL